VLVRGHYNSVLAAEDVDPDNRVIDVTRYPDIADLYVAADALVTDYSSVFFDFATLRRPILFFTYDLEKYRDQLRGFYLDFEAEAPGPLLRTNDELVSALRDVDYVRARYGPVVDRFAATYCPRDDGAASDRVLDAFFGPVIGPTGAQLSDQGSKRLLVSAQVEGKAGTEGF
jgi:CDP-glycerol glycerophosphotransferase